MLGQAPPEAVAYRLALPARSHAALPRIAPAPDAGGHLRAYSLNPFELPSDVRLRHDQVYRILWVGPHGEPIPPQGTGHLPALHFFLGPADAASSETDDEYEAVLRGVSDPELRRQSEAEVVRLRLTTLHQRQEAALCESELDLLAAELRLWNEQAAVTQELLQEQREELERLAEQQREQQERTREAHAKAEMKSLLRAVAVVLGVPAISTAVAVLQRKLDGDPMDWSEAAEQILEQVQHLATNFVQHYKGAKLAEAEIQHRDPAPPDVRQASVCPRHCPADAAEIPREGFRHETVETRGDQKMSTGADEILARAWRRAHSEKVQTEGFLEDALVAALEEPSIWHQLRAHLGWDKALPAQLPKVTRQDQAPVEKGRTDIRLSWPGRRPLVLELKIYDPPNAEQIQRYLDAGSDVAAIAGIPAQLDVQVPAGGQFLGVIPWRRIRELPTAGAPLQLRQLHQLLDATGVIVPYISEQVLTGMHASWDAWGTFSDWCFHALESVQKLFWDQGFQCVWKDRKLGKIDESHRRFAWWMWPRPWRDSFAVVVGLNLGRDSRPLLVAGMPDLYFALHLNPEAARRQMLCDDPRFQAAVRGWQSRATEGSLVRESAPKLWDLLRARASTSDLLHAPDQGAALQTWMKQRAEEWIADGIVACLAQLSHQVAAGPAQVALPPTEAVETESPDPSPSDS